MTINWHKKYSEIRKEVIDVSMTQDGKGVVYVTFPDPRKRR